MSDGERRGDRGGRNDRGRRAETGEAGDSAADDEVDPDAADPTADPDVGDLYDELTELEALANTAEERERIRSARRMAVEVGGGSVFGNVVHGFDRSDAAEALLGSLLFGIPMFVEGGTQEVAEFVAARPAFLVATNAMALALAVGILYVADIQDVRVKNPLLGLVPRKLVGVLGIATVTALVVMTVWGRVDWATPWLAYCQVSVAVVPMVIGAALGDILPG